MELGFSPAVFPQSHMQPADTSALLLLVKFKPDCGICMVVCDHLGAPLARI